jgi:hypothetical protein
LSPTLTMPMMKAISKVDTEARGGLHVRAIDVNHFVDSAYHDTHLRLSPLAHDLHHDDASAIVGSLV